MSTKTWKGEEIQIISYWEDIPASYSYLDKPVLHTKTVINYTKDEDHTRVHSFFVFQLYHFKTTQPQRYG